MDLEELLAKAKQYVRDEGNWNTLCLPYETPDFVYQEEDKFWRAYQDYTGQEIAEESQGSFIRCGC